MLFLMSVKWMKGFKSLAEFWCLSRLSLTSITWGYRAITLGDSQELALKNGKSKILRVIIEVEGSLSGIWWHVLKNKIRDIIITENYLLLFLFSLECFVYSSSSFARHLKKVRLDRTLRELVSLNLLWLNTRIYFTLCLITFL